MKKVLLVAPEFPPSNTAGAHRPRLFAKHLPRYGWHPSVLSVRADLYEGSLDPALETLLSPDLPLVRTRAIPVRPIRFIGDLGLRTLPYHAAALRRIIRNGAVDAVVLFGPPWFSFALGPWVCARARVPYVVDYIDPWISDWTSEHSFLSKGWMYRRLAAAIEPAVLRRAEHVTAVSEGILSDLRRNYSWLKPENMSSMPYGAEPEDMIASERLGIMPPDFRPDDGQIHVCLTGAFQPRGTEVLRAVFEAARKLREQQPEMGARLVFRFYGTSNLTWGHGRFSVLPIAQSMGLADMVSEIPERIPYLQSLAVLRCCSVVLVMGSWEHYYHASKLYPAILSKKPILALCHEESSINKVINDTASGACVTFRGPEEIADKIPEIATALESLLSKRDTGDRGVDYEQFSAHAATGVLARALDRATNNLKSMMC